MTELELQLRDLGARLEHPPTPDLAAAVRARLEAVPARRRLLPSRRALAIALAALGVAVGAVLAVPQARRAILEWLGLKGVVIERVPELPEVPARTSLALGERVTLEQARERASFEVAVPTLGELDEPDEVYFSGQPPGGQVAFLYGSKERPRLLLTQFPGEAVIEKLIGFGTRAEPVTVDGGRGVWLEGEPHVFVYRDAAGNFREETVRLFGNVLIWEQGELTLRLEADISKEEALGIARSIR